MSNAALKWCFNITPKKIIKYRQPYAKRSWGFLHRLPAEDVQLFRCCAKVDSLPGAAAWNDSEGSHRCRTSRFRFSFFVWFILLISSENLLFGCFYLMLKKKHEDAFFSLFFFIQNDILNILLLTFRCQQMLHSERSNVVKIDYILK